MQSLTLQVQFFPPGENKLCFGSWEMNTSVWSMLSRNKLFKENPEIKVAFSKVEAHTGNDFNEIADGLAKLAVGLNPNPIFYRMLEKHKLTI